MITIKNEKGQGATEYLLMLAAVLVVAAAAIYYVTQAGGGYPAIGATPTPYDSDADGTKEAIAIEVTTGSIASRAWSYSIDLDPQNDTWSNGSESLDAPRVTLDNFTPGAYASDDSADNTFYVSLRHTDSGHIYFSNEPVTLEDDSDIASANSA
ncbi:hypothetical protein AKJ39_04630 [candidate division MSBL1 archaeon SCGC-AAA259J03]|uniref:Archaeal Type IV pilin N-terminal domain-containing protein n=1 Tax=candidate division MSBL1 archaeon SCGC-AAA259J03 TaxID=1698269 RepID=A0A656YXI9_9EURY|nr:hypothetical protein AKJ39_04630 [candidate division MSBL1 archaeon SCGC-AAA259J03]